MIAGKRQSRQTHPKLRIALASLLPSSWPAPPHSTVLSVYGSEDGVLDMGKYEQYRSNLPTDTWEVVIDGGCHAGFGRYGAQDGDGTPTISSDEQINRTAEEIVRMMGLLSQ